MVFQYTRQRQPLRIRPPQKIERRIRYSKNLAMEPHSPNLVDGFFKNIKNFVEMAPTFESTAVSSAADNKRSGSGSGDLNTRKGLPVLVLKNRINALVVDEDCTSRSIERSLLHWFGVDTVGIESGRVAVDMFADGEIFHLVLIDMYLHEMDGAEAIRQIRAMGLHCKILAVSGAPFDLLGEEFLEAGADEYIEKPLHPQKLMDILIEIDNLL